MVTLCSDHKLRSEEKKSVFGAHFTFQIFNTEQRNMYKDHRTLDLAAVNADELESWKASFLRAGVYPEYVNADDAKEDAKEETKESADPQLERQVETIRNLVESYIQIVIKNIKDQTPKMIMCLMLNNTREFIAEELLAKLYEECNPQSLMDESSTEVERKRELLRIYNSLKEAVKIVGDINMSTHTTTTPAPVNNEWINDNSNGQARQSRGAPPPPRPPASVSRNNDPFAELRQITQPGWSASTVPAVPQRNSPVPGNMMLPRPSQDNAIRAPPQIPRRPGQQPPTIPSRPSNF